MHLPFVLFIHEFPREAYSPLRRPVYKTLRETDCVLRVPWTLKKKKIVIACNEKKIWIFWVGWREKFFMSLKAKFWTYSDAVYAPGQKKSESDCRFCCMQPASCICLLSSSSMNFPREAYSPLRRPVYKTLRETDCMLRVPWTLKKKIVIACNEKKFEFSG